MDGLIAELEDCFTYKEHGWDVIVDFGLVVESLGMANLCYMTGDNIYLFQRIVKCRIK